MKIKWQVVALLMSFALVMFAVPGCEEDEEAAGPSDTFEHGTDIDVLVAYSVIDTSSWVRYEWGEEYLDGEWQGDPIMVSSLTVSRASNPDVVLWGISTPGEDGIVSPAAHGVVPDGAMETNDEMRELERGQTYRFIVTTMDGRSGGMDFTPEWD